MTPSSSSHPTRATSLASTDCAISDPLMKKRSEEHTSELQSRLHLVCRLLLEKKITPAGRLDLGAVFFMTGIELHRVKDHEDVGYHHAVQIMQAGKEAGLAYDASGHVNFLWN